MIIGFWVGPYGSFNMFLKFGGPVWVVVWGPYMAVPQKCRACNRPERPSCDNCKACNRIGGLATNPPLQQAY